MDSFDEPISILITEDNKSYIGSRIDRVLSEALPDFSRGFIQKLIVNGEVEVANKPIKASYKLKTGDCITVRVPKSEEIEITAENIALDIIYEDNDIIVINKPKGMVVHPAPGHYSGTLVNALMYHCKDSLSSINGVLRPGIVHRIDANTTGLLVVCKNDIAHRIMSDKFKIHDITRVYTAICYNQFKEPEGTIDKPIGRNKTDRKMMSIDPNGRHAITHYKVIENLEQNMSLIECRLETGRTHQIRVHMASIMHPLLGDDVYGPKSPTIKVNDGQVLHAGTLGFVHPITNEYLEFHAKLPDSFTKILERLRKK